MDRSIVLRIVKFIGTLAFIALVIVGIRTVLANRWQAGSASEFVEKFSAAYRRKDVGTVMKMTADPKIMDLAGIDEDLKKAVRSYNLESEKDRLKEEFKQESMFYQAWCETRFEREVEHSDHIHVSVKIRGAGADIVLVKQDGYLKIHPFPSLFTCGSD